MKIADILRTARSEPLVHFLIAGLIVFLIYGWIGAPVDADSRKILITEQQVLRLSNSWQTTWNRPATPQELDGLIRDHIKEEVYYREALRLELDRDDPVIRRRLRTKMEFIANSAAENEAPGDAVLQAWLDGHQARYAKDPKLSFTQIYVNAENGSDKALPRAQAILSMLRSNAKPAPSGDSISLPEALIETPIDEINRTFGDGFGEQLSRKTLNQWVGPIESGFGLHLVRILKVTSASTPKLSEVRQLVENDWRSENRTSREAKAYQALLDGYDIEIKRP